MDIYQAGWKSDSRFRVAVCGRRFGKTFEAAEEMRRAIKFAVRENISPENEIWYGAPTYKQAKKIFWPRLKSTVPRHWLKSAPRESDLALTIRPYGHIVRVVGLENYDALRGSGLFFFLGDEWADVKPEVWNEILRPMLSTAQGHALFIGTPKGRDHFHDLYLKGQDGPGKEPGWWSCSYTTLDGGNVPPAEIENARQCLDIRQFRQEYEASFETFSGRCLYAFSREKSIRNMSYNAEQAVHIGLDFNVNPISATVWQEKTDENGNITSFQIDEIVLPTSNTDEIAQEILRRYGKKKILFSGEESADCDHITIYPDPSGQANRTSSCGRTDISILKSFGFNINVMKKAPKVRERLNITNAMFENSAGERRAYVSPVCRKSIESYERYIYRSGTSEPDKNGGFDHLVDATGYYFFFRFLKPDTSPPLSRILER
ncbi:terminase [Acetobacter musti]|uniref:Terminase n=1 Tax=Acetobacter musti TaxID=864732 RepID=A0ABX0JR14_9PROT|nr:terminase family protein [Acetobacter musti]NHN84483.1 terminase [Acetobacter musti]